MVPRDGARPNNVSPLASSRKREAASRRKAPETGPTALDTTTMADCSVSRCAVGEQVYISNSAAIARKDEPFDASPVMGLTLHMSGSAGSVQP